MNCPLLESEVRRSKVDEQTKKGIRVSVEKLACVARASFSGYWMLDDATNHLGRPVFRCYHECVAMDRDGNADYSSVVCLDHLATRALSTYFYKALWIETSFYCIFNWLLDLICGSPNYNSSFGDE